VKAGIPSVVTGEQGASDALLTRYQRWLVGLGGGLVALGIAVMVAGRRGASDGVVGLVGLLALFVGLYYAAARLTARPDPVEPPPVATRHGVRRAGAPFETSVEATTTGDSAEAPVEALVSDRLEALATERLRIEGGVDEATARDRLATGRWTDDPVAAGFFADDGGKGGLLGGPSFPGQVARTVDAIAALSAGEAGDEEAREWLDDPDPRSSPRPWQSGQYRTGHWRGVAGLGLCALAAAAVAETPVLVLVGGVLLGVAGYARLGEPPEPAVAAERSFDAEDPRPGDRVGVTVTVTNESDSVLPDVRLTDGVPDRLAVVDGSPHHAAALAPGEAATFSYEVLAVYGSHEFDAVHAAARDPSGQHERTSTQETATTTLSCEPAGVQSSVPLHPQETGIVGRVPSESGGTGQEFRSVREYRRGDPLGRVDWHRLARSGELATLQFREEHAATVVILVDARLPSFRTTSGDALSAVDRSLAGAARLFATLEKDGDRVGLASVGPEPLWIGPGAGSEHRACIRSTLEHYPSFAPSEWEQQFCAAEYVRQLRQRLPAETQLVLFSPLLDEPVVEVARRLHAHGHELTVFSPDPTRSDTVGGTVARLERECNREPLRTDGIRTIDWASEESLADAVARSTRRWQR